MGHTWGRQDPGGPHVGPMSLALWEALLLAVVQLTKIREYFSDPDYFLYIRDSIAMF